MIDLNYKNHELISFKNSNVIFTCNKCNNIFKINNYYDKIYYNTLDVKTGIFGIDNLQLSCEENLIKDIIE